MTSNKILTKFDILKLFKENMVNFFDALIDRFNKESDFVLLRIYLDCEIPIEDSMNVFTNRILPYLDMIKNKDENFFLQCDELFEGISQNKVTYFKDFWLSGELTEDDKEQMWRWFRYFVNLANQYKK